MLSSLEIIIRDINFSFLLLNKLLFFLSFKVFLRKIISFSNSVLVALFKISLYLIKSINSFDKC